MSEKTRLLVVDDEENIRDLLAAALRFADFEVATASCGNEALESVRDFRPDLIVLDVMMPDMDGFTLTRRLRARGDDMPVLFLTARSDSQDAVRGLRAGGDDYVTKPFSLDEVVARINAILRRTAPVTNETVLRAGAVELDEDTHEVRRSGELVDLSPTEFTLLRYLLLNAGRVVGRQQILDHVCGYDYLGDGAVVESYISYLRRKIDVPGTQSFITTKRGFGYLLRADWQPK